MAYDLKSLEAPRAAGGVLRTLVAAIESPGAGSLIANKVLEDSGIFAFRKTPVTGGPDAQAPVFEHHRESCALDHRADAKGLADTLEAAGDDRAGFAMERADDFASAYREGTTDPVAVAKRTCEIIAATEASRPRMRLLIAHDESDLMRQAEASAERHRKGQPRGPLDGVPIAVKDEVDQLGYPTTVGTRFLGRDKATRDGEIVLRLRQAGALLLGKANMHEIGIGVTGINPHHGAARNPYDPACFTGGSSSGSAAAVGSGLCPIAVSADGGGSIRTPASLCGQVGLKPTYGRLSEHGAAELCWSVGHLGPIASSVVDCAVAYAVMCGPDDKDHNSTLQPLPVFDDIANRDLTSLRIGVYRPWFEDAESAVVSGCQAGLDALTAAGATVVDISIDGLETARVAHAITIVSEMAAAHAHLYERHRGDYGHDTRMNLAIGRRLGATDYVHAQRHRAHVYRRFAKLLTEVDVIATPTTAVTAKPISEDALSHGESDLTLLSKIMRFAPVGNLTGLPTITVPSGYDDVGMPVGFQLMGRAWDEHLLLRLARVVEATVERRQPRVWHGYFR